MIYLFVIIFILMNNTRPINIAIVDDNKMNIELLSETLSGVDACIYTYSSAKTVLEDCINTKFDIFLLDIMMPIMSGFELAKYIKANELNSSSIIVFVSALSDTQTKLESYGLGAHSYIEKPYNIQLVRAQVENLIKDRKNFYYEDYNKENFVAMLTHDLKSPISSEINALELLTKNQFGTVTNSQKEVLTNVLSTAKYMKHLTDQILTFYKQKCNRVSLIKEDVILSEVVKESIYCMEFMLSEKNQQVYFQNNIGNRSTKVDILEIKRLINNLISNASKYSPENSDIFIELYSNSSEFVIRIKDFGYGIETKNLKNIFNEYITLAKKQKQVGFGLGLNICKKIVEAHKGKISINSKINEGTTVEFTIP